MSQLMSVNEDTYKFILPKVMINQEATIVYMYLYFYYPYYPQEVGEFKWIIRIFIRIVYNGYLKGITQVFVSLGLSGF